MDGLLTFFGVERGRVDPPVDVFPLGITPFIRLARDQRPATLVAQAGILGLHAQAQALM